jgi:hypothetical protein
MSIVSVVVLLCCLVLCCMLDAWSILFLSSTPNLQRALFPSSSSLRNYIAFSEVKTILVDDDKVSIWKEETVV